MLGGVLLSAVLLNVLAPFWSSFLLNVGTLMHKAKYTRLDRLIETVMSELVKVVKSFGTRVRIFEKLAVTDSGVSIRIPLFG
jgi:hypothetical protein